MTTTGRTVGGHRKKCLPGNCVLGGRVARKKRHGHQYQTSKPTEPPACSLRQRTLECIRLMRAVYRVARKQNHGALPWAEPDSHHAQLRDGLDAIWTMILTKIRGENNTLRQILHPLYRSWPQVGTTNNFIAKRSKTASQILRLKSLYSPQKSTVLRRLSDQQMRGLTWVYF